MKPFHIITNKLLQIARELKGQNYENDDNIWEKLCTGNRQWDKGLSAAKGSRILVATSTGGHPAVTPIESLLAAALTLHGAQVHFLLCDKVLPACLLATTTSFKNQSEFPEFGPQKSICDTCFKTGMDIYKPLELPIHLYSELVTLDEQTKLYSFVEKIDLTNIKDFRIDGFAIGEHALAGALRYFAKADLSDEPFGQKVLQRYTHAALVTMHVIQKLFAQQTFDCIVFHHGIYIPQGIVGEVARSKNIRVVNWNPAYRKKCFIFSHNDTYHHTLITESTNKWENIKWTKKLQEKTLNYLKSRWVGTQDWIWFHEKPSFDLTNITEKYKIDLKKTCIGMLTNVMWDAQLHYTANAFPDMLTWIIKSIKYFKKRPQLQLIIRIHPAEIRGTLPSRQKVADEIRKVFPKLPENIVIIPPESNASTYAVMSICNTVLIYGTKTGVELTSMGIPTIVAGEAWIRNKGITMDAKTEDEYFRLLDKLPLGKRMNMKEITKARKYAFHFFFRRMIPIDAIKETPGWPPYKLAVKKLEELFPGGDRGLDVICDGILSGKEFIYPAENYV